MKILASYALSNSILVRVQVMVVVADLTGTEAHLSFEFVFCVVSFCNSSGVLIDFFTFTIIHWLVSIFNAASFLHDHFIKMHKWKCYYKPTVSSATHLILMKH